MRFKVSCRLQGKCRDCGFCSLHIACPGEWNCSGCGACVAACPYEARELEEVSDGRGFIGLEIDGQPVEVPERITVLDALKIAGYSVSRLAGADIHAPCCTGGCWSCAVLVDGGLRPSCITQIRDGMNISTDRAEVEKFKPLRIVTGFHGHTVGGVGTPHWLKPRGVFRYIEVACFAHGCILRCPTCQNWEATYSSIEEPLTPVQAARLTTEARKRWRVDRMAISGGEPTLNRRWLLGYFKELHRLNPDANARLHLDTNAVLLTRDYIDELVEVGMTDIGIDVKGLELGTFMRITGITEEGLARELLETEWDALKYILDRYRQEVFVGVGIPYNPKLISLEEVARIGERIASWEPDVQTCALDYRGEFRRRDLLRPSFEDMVKVWRLLKGTGLKTVIAQTTLGHIGPDKPYPF